MPDWTDANAHDPGTPLLRLVAWLGAGLVAASLVAAYRRSRRDP